MAQLEHLNKLYRQEAHYFGHIEGLRAFTALRVMLHHLAVFGVLFFEPAQYSQMLNHPFFKLASSTSVLLDVFFIISGFVISYSLINRYKATGTLDFYRFMVRRCARVLPVYFFVIVVCGIMLMENFSYVWTNILQINNMLPVQHQFMPWTWSVAVDFQFYVLFAVFMWLLAKRFIGKKTSYVLAFSFCLLPIIIIPILISTQDFYHLTKNVYIINQPEAWKFFNMGFDKLYVRIPAILSGIISAYLVVYHQDQLRSRILNTSKLLINFCVLMLLAVVLFLLVNDPIWFFDLHHPVWQTSTYWTMLIQHFTFALVMCPLLLLAQFPRGIVVKGIVGILKSVVLRPLGRLSYGTYMIHPIVFIIGYAIYFATHSTITAEMYFQYGLILILITYLLAVPLFLFLEQPAIHKIKSLLLNRKEGLPPPLQVKT